MSVNAARSALLMLLAALPALTAPPTFGTGGEVKADLDPAASKIEFTLGDVLHTVHGTFRLQRGSVQFDPATGKASGELVVDAASGDSGSKARDRRMHADILESDRFPEITFHPTRIEGNLNAQGPSPLSVTGIFRLHGADHELVVPATVEIHGNRITGVMRFQVPYVKWGLKNPSTFFLRVSSQVQIDLHLDASLMVQPR